MRAERMQQHDMILTGGQNRFKAYQVLGSHFFITRGAIESWAIREELRTWLRVERLLHDETSWVAKANETPLCLMI